MKYHLVLEVRELSDKMTEYQELSRREYRWRWVAKMLRLRGVIVVDLPWSGKVLARERLEKVDA